MVFYKRRKTTKKAIMPVRGSRMYRADNFKSIRKSLRIIQKQINKEQEYIYTNYESYNNVVGNQFLSYNMCDYSAAIPCFGATVNDCSDNKIFHQYTKVQGYLSLEAAALANNETSTRHYTLLLVRLKDVATSAALGWNSSTGVINVPGATASTVYRSSEGIGFLNPKLFKVIKRKEITLTNHTATLANSTAQTQSGTDYRFSWKINNKSYIENPAGNWKELSCPQDPSRNYYLIVLNNEDSGDSQWGTLRLNITQCMRKI